jgi:DNA processing protein
MERTELAAWLWLLGTPGIGPVYARRLLAAWGSPQAIRDAPASALRAVVGLRLATALQTPRDAASDPLERTWQWLHEQPERHILVLGDPGYPDRLLQTDDPPLLLYVQGQLAALAHPRSVAMVGSRNATPQGLGHARAFARHLSEQGVCIVSGLALGIDGAAHEGALEGPAPTVAVVGTGLDRVYPRQHLALARRIVAQGALVSEYPIGTAPLAAHFPQRNRLIAGLSHGTLMVEAALQSGSLITATQAVQMGREVFAIPGSVHSPQSRGCHLLIRQGARLVESAQDILEELHWSGAAPPSASPPTAPAAADTDHDVLRAMGFDPCTLDILQARTGWETARLQTALLALEWAGEVGKAPGGLFQRLGKG